MIETAPARIDATVLDVDLTGYQTGTRHVLGPIKFALKAGETLAVVGPSGIGKSTLLRCILGLETRFTGQIRTASHQTAVFQEPALFGWRTVLANIQIPTGASAAQAESLLERVGLSGRGADFPGQLSLGQQRRVALARALAARPDVLCLDEPFVSLDADLAQGMRDLVANLQRELALTIILVTHDQTEARSLADRIITLGGSPAHIVHSERIGAPS